MQKNAFEEYYGITKKSWLKMIAEEAVDFVELIWMAIGALFDLTVKKIKRK